MNEHPIQGLMDVTLEKIKKMVDSNTIIGNPINMADGTLILPISKVSFGFASGGSDIAPKPAKTCLAAAGEPACPSCLWRSLSCARAMCA